MNNRRIILAIGVGVLLYASFILYRQWALLKKSCVKIVDYRFQSLGLQTSRLMLTLLIKNKTNFDFLIKSEKLNVSINGIKVSEVSNKKRNEIKAGSDNTINIVIDIDTAMLIRNGLNILSQSPNNIQINIEGKLTVVTSGVLLNNIHINETVSLSDILKPTSNNC